MAPTAEYDEAAFDAVMRVNAKGVFLGLRHVLPVMIAQGRGAVVNTASTAGLVGTAGMSAFVASKRAVIGLTKVAAGEVGPLGVRVNAVCPGPIATRMVQDIARQVSPNNPEGVEERYAASIPLRRYGTAEEVADVVLFLCSDLVGNVTRAIRRRRRADGGAGGRVARERRLTRPRQGYAGKVVGAAARLQPLAYSAGFAAAGSAPSATSTSCAALKASSPAGMPQ